MSNPKNALQERVAKFKGQHNIVYSDIASAGSAFQCSVTVTLTWQGVSKQWTATSVRSRCSKKESHFETAELLLGDSDLLYHCDAKNWSIPSQSSRPEIGSEVNGNFKTRLNELCMRVGVVARYDTTLSAPFLSTVTIANPDVDEGVAVAGLRAGTKKAAEQAAAAAALADPSILAMLRGSPGHKVAQTIPDFTVPPQKHAEFAVLPAANTVQTTAEDATAADPNPKGRLLELFARNQSLLCLSVKSPVFSTSTTAPFVSTLTIQLPRVDTAAAPGATQQGAVVLTGPGCTTKKAAEQAVAALALRDTQVRQLLRLPPLLPAEWKVKQIDDATVAAGATASKQEPVPAEGDSAVADVDALTVVVGADECQPDLLQPAGAITIHKEADASPAQAPLSGSSERRDGANSERPLASSLTAQPSVPAAPAAALSPVAPVGDAAAAENPKGRLLELFARLGCPLGPGPQFRTTAVAPFVSTLVVSLPEGAATAAIPVEDANRAVVLTGPERASKKAAEQAVSALALQDARIRRAMGLDGPRPLGTGVSDGSDVVAVASLAQPALANDGTNYKGKLLELCAKVPLSAQVRPVFSTSTSAPFVSTVQLRPDKAVVGPGRSTKKAAEQAVAALALQDSEVADLLHGGP